MVAGDGQRSGGGNRLLVQQHGQLAVTGLQHVTVGNGIAHVPVVAAGGRGAADAGGELHRQRAGLHLGFLACLERQNQQRDRGPYPDHCSFHSALPATKVECPGPAPRGNRPGCCARHRSCRRRTCSPPTPPRRRCGRGRRSRPDRRGRRCPAACPPRRG